MNHAAKSHSRHPLLLACVLSLVVCASLGARTSNDPNELLPDNTDRQIVFAGTTPRSLYFTFYTNATQYLRVDLMAQGASAAATLKASVTSWSVRSEILPRADATRNVSMLLDMQQYEFAQYCDARAKACTFNVTLAPSEPGMTATIKLLYVYSGTGEAIQDLTQDVSATDIAYYAGAQYANAVFSYRYYGEVAEGEKAIFRAHYNSLTASAIVKCAKHDISTAPKDRYSTPFPFAAPQDVDQLLAARAAQYTVYNSSSCYVICKYAKCAVVVNVFVVPNNNYVGARLQTAFTPLTAFQGVSDGQSVSARVTTNGGSLFANFRLNTSSVHAENALSYLTVRASGCYDATDSVSPLRCVFQVCVAPDFQDTSTFECQISRLTEAQVPNFVPLPGAAYFVTVYGNAYPYDVPADVSLVWSVRAPITATAPEYSGWDSARVDVENATLVRYRLSPDDKDNNATKIYSQQDTSRLRFLYNVCADAAKCEVPTASKHDGVVQNVAQNPITFPALQVGGVLVLNIENLDYDPAAYNLPRSFQFDFYPDPPGQGTDQKKSQKGWEIAGIVLITLIGGSVLAFAIKHFFFNKKGRVLDNATESVYSEDR